MEEKKMVKTREELIEILVQDRIDEWVHARMHEGLEEALRFGFKGYDDYSDDELKEALTWVADYEDTEVTIIRQNSN